MSLIPKIDRLYYHARKTSPPDYRPYALRLDSWLFKELMATTDAMRDIQLRFPDAPPMFMGMRVIIESYNDGGNKHTLAVETKQQGEHGRSMYFDYSDLPADAHNARLEGTLSEPVTTDGAEGPANAPK